jgi:hypothetical protein
MGNGALAIGLKLPRPSSTLPERTFGGPVHITLFLPTIIELTVLGERASMSGLGCAGLNEPETARLHLAQL